MRRAATEEAAEAADTAVAASSDDYKSKLAGYKVLVAGATGKTGMCVVEALREYDVPVRALVRSKSKAMSELKGAGEKGLDVVEADVFQYATLPRAFGDANALIICTGASSSLDPLGPFNVDFQGTLNLLALAQQKKVKKIILVSSIGADTLINLLNLFWGVLFWKKRAEEAIQRSGIEYTIVRPGGLKSQGSKKGGKEQGDIGNIVMKPAGYYGVPPVAPPQEEAGSILRSQVADVCVAALVEPSASNKVVEVIAKKNAPKMSMAELFNSVE